MGVGEEEFNLENQIQHIQKESPKFGTRFAPPPPLASFDQPPLGAASFKNFRFMLG